ncbi:MAG: hypothetical protein ACE5ER_02055, partial [Nitrospinaceae bacterium]
DFSAATPQGRLATVLTSMFGIGCFAVLTGIILEGAMQRRMKKLKGEGNYQGEGHLIIVNVPSYAETIELLKELDHSPDFRDTPRVIVTAALPNQDKEAPDSLVRRIDGFIMGLPSALETLERANVRTAKACVLISSSADPAMDDTNTLTAGLIEKTWPQVLTIMACSRSETMNNLSTFGIDGGISTTGLQMGLLVQELEDPGVYQVYSELSSNAGGNQIYISQTPIGKWEGNIEGLHAGQLKIAAIQLNYPVEIIGLKRVSKNKLMLNPENDLALAPSDHLVYLAEERFNWLKNSRDILRQVNQIS